jgi:hypothetical protein
MIPALAQQAEAKPAPYRRPRRASLIADGRKAEAKLFKRAVAQLTELAGGQPNALQRRWIDQAAGLTVMLHVLTKEACASDKVPPSQATAYAAASKQLTALTDRIVQGKPSRLHERQEPPERPDLRGLLVEDDGDG